MSAAGFNELGSDFANKRLARVRDKLDRGDTVFLVGLGLPGTHNSGAALVEVTRAHGPRLIVNNEEERFSGNKHTTEYPAHSIYAMLATLRGMGRDVADIDAWLTSWDYFALAGMLGRTLVEEAPQSLMLARVADAIVDIACAVKPDEATLVPERREELTTEGGLDVIAHQAAVAKAMAKLHREKIDVSLFIDPDTRQIEMAKLLGAKAVEIQTARFSEARVGAGRDRELALLREAADYARQHGLDEARAAFGVVLRVHKLASLLVELRGHLVERHAERVDLVAVGADGDTRAQIAGRDAATHGEAKNSWLTGTAAWNYAAITQWILGIRPNFDGLQIAPVIPTTSFFIFRPGRSTRRPA